MIGRAESPDLVNWSEPSTLLVPDGRDPPDLQFYALHVAVYEGYFVGMLWTHVPDRPVLASGFQGGPEAGTRRDCLQWPPQMRSSSFIDAPSVFDLI